MKSVLISTRPQWVEKICHKIGEDETGKAIYEKRIEVRKTAPKEVPFKCYIYESRNGGHRCKHCNEKDSCYSYAPKNVGCYNGSGKVIGWFICDKVDEYHYDYCDGVDIDDDTILETAIDREDINIYAKGKTLYGWHISNLTLYDKPKELSEFCIPCKVSCENCKNPLYFECWCEEKGEKIVTRPPQSWCYVEDLGEKNEQICSSRKTI